MRIVHVIPSLSAESGGPARSVVAFASAMAGHGHDVELVYKVSGTDVPPKAADSMRCVRRRGLRRSGLSLYWELLRLLLRISADVVVIHSIWNIWSTTAALVCWYRALPYILSPHGMLAECCLKRHSFRKRLYYHCVDWLVARNAIAMRFLNSKEEQSSRAGWVKVGRSIIAPNGVDISGLSTPPLDPVLRQQLSGKKIMMYLGRLHPIKRLDLQLEALGILRDVIPSLTWVLVGPDEGEWQRLFKRASKAGLDRRLCWLGPISSDQRYSLLAAADVVLQTSDHEGHSMAVNEALAIGVPLVLTCGVNFPEVATAGAGLEVPSSPQAVADAVLAILSDPALAEHMRAAGRAYATRQLAWSVLTVTFGEAVMRLLKRELGHTGLVT